ncbi:MAG TPA: tetratricopeptide repeat protein [Bryobacteraceae bacterium]|jgi:tetratricopeptide (TPR) repeat protein
MFLRPNPNAQPVRLAVAALALGAFYWGLYRMPVPGAKTGLDPEKSRELQDEAAVMRRYGKWARALPPTMKLHNAYPESHIYIGQLAEIYDHLGKFREEAAMWEQFLLHAPRPIEGCPQIGEAYEKQGLAKEAITAFEKCLAIEPESSDQIFYLARALERDGQTDRAAELYARGAAANPTYSDLAIGLARMRLRQGKPDEARRLAAGALVESPNNADALLVLGLACVRKGDRAAARNYLERGVRVADGYADLHLALANLDEQDANLSQAIEHYQKAVALDKSNLQAAQRLDLLRRAARE